MSIAGRIFDALDKNGIGVLREEDLQEELLKARERDRVKIEVKKFWTVLYYALLLCIALYEKFWTVPYYALLLWIALYKKFWTVLYYALLLFIALYEKL